MLRDMFFVNLGGTPLVSLITLCFFFTATSATGDWGDYLVTNKAVEVLQGPDDRFPARTKLEEGRLVVELDRIRGFVQVRIPHKSHLSGWIRANNLGLIRKWAEAANYPEGHPAASGELDFGISPQEKSQPRQSYAGVWSLFVVGLIVVVVLILVWRKRFPKRLGAFGIDHVKQFFFKIRDSVCQRICGARIEIPEDESGKSY